MVQSNSFFAGFNWIHLESYLVFMCNVLVMEQTAYTMCAYIFFDWKDRFTSCTSFYAEWQRVYYLFDVELTSKSTKTIVT